MEKPTPKERAIEIVEKYEDIEHSFCCESSFYEEMIIKSERVKCSIIYQEGIINKLKEYSIVSEYEQEVLNELKK